MSGVHWQPSASLQNLQVRARLLQGIRAFFAERDVLEVETPVLSPCGITDPQLESFSSHFRGREYFLHTSPEFYMKRLLAAGSGDIYQLARVFRVDEQGRQHNPEFTLLEWYRCGYDHFQLMDEVEQLLRVLFSDPELTVKRISYQQVFLEQLQIDPLDATADELRACAIKHQIEIPQGMHESDRDMWLDWLMVSAVAPAFKKQRFSFIYDYPASQAALAKLNPQDPRVAHRFELYFAELELANGFFELTDAEEQARRFADENAQRAAQGKKQVPIDTGLLAALEHGLPDCAGVALGVDRLLMLLCAAEHIEEVISFATEQI